MSKKETSANLPKAVIIAAFANDPDKDLASLDEERKIIPNFPLG